MVLLQLVNFVKCWMVNKMKVGQQVVSISTRIDGIINGTKGVIIGRQMKSYRDLGIDEDGFAMAYKVNFVGNRQRLVPEWGVSYV